jgi:hypothetical protein
MRKHKKKCEGQGLINSTVKDIAKTFHKVNDVTNKLINGSQSFSPNVKQILNKFGNEKVTGLVIGRNPLNYALTKFIKKVSTTPYDKLFHLFIIIETSKGKIYFEKNENVNASTNPFEKTNPEYLRINNFNHEMTVNEMLQNAIKRMGSSKFFNYSASSSNCQDWLLNLLQSNNITEGIQFVKQDTESIFKNNPLLRKFSNTVTNTLAKVDIIKQGGSLLNSIKHLYHIY